MEERTLGGQPGTGQDVTIILVPNGGSKDQKLALIHLHSHVLSTHSNYFNTYLSERGKKPASPSPSTEFVLEAQTDVPCYFDCFSSMYQPIVKTFQGVKHGVELLKAASQIDFRELMERISLYLSTVFWSDEDAIMVREYSASPDFPRIHLKDLVSRLGLDESEEDRQKHLCAVVRHCTSAVLKASSTQDDLLLFLQSIGCGPPSDFSRMAIAAITQEAKDVFVDIGKDWNGKIPGNSNNRYASLTVERIQRMCRILEALLKGRVADELMRGIVHLDTIPDYVSRVTESNSVIAAEKFAKLVLVMYKEVIAGHLLLGPPERVALLANWLVVMEASLKKGSFEQAATDLLSTLPLKQQTELLNLRSEGVCDYISTKSLISLFQSHRGPGQAGK